MLDTVTDARLAALGTLFAGLQIQVATLRDGGSLWPRTFAPRRVPVLRDQPR